MTRLILIGVDDTDTLDSVGTGRVARGLAERLQGLSLGASQGVTRHQLLVHPAIPYTSHNSALCVGLESEASLERIVAASCAYLRTAFVPGSDPGLCVAEAAVVSEGVARFGREAQQRVLDVAEAHAAARAGALFLESLGGAPHGVIGALAAVGLRAGGNDGRFVDLPGVREVGGVLTVAELLRRTAVTAVVDGEGNKLGDSELVDTLDWVRPSLVGGKPMLRVKRDTMEEKNRWVPSEPRNRDRRGED